MSEKSKTVKDMIVQVDAFLRSWQPDDSSPMAKQFGKIIAEVEKVREILEDKDYLTECRIGKHPLIRILTTQPAWDDTCSVVRWCPVCGAVVVDMEIDGRTHPGRDGKMRLPKITLKEK